MARTIVPQLERDAPFDRLLIADRRLRLDANDPVRASDFGVPGPEVARDRQGNLRLPGEGWMEALAESPKQRELGPVAQPPFGWIGASGEFEPHDPARGAKEQDRRVLERAVLEPTDVRVRNAKSGRHVTEAQARRDAGGPEVRLDTSERLPRPPSSAIRWPLTRSHPAGSIAVGAYPRLIREAPMPGVVAT